jgi:transcriptional regulator with XRE-family HTH domain
MSVTSKVRQLAKLKRKPYRDAYVAEQVKTGLPFQIRALREQRGWSQSELGDNTGMRQNAISRLEKPDYGSLTVNTLLRLASAFDVALLIKFVPFRKLLDEFGDLSTEALEVDAFDQEVPVLEEDALSVISGWKVITSRSIRLPQPNRIVFGGDAILNSWSHERFSHIGVATGTIAITSSGLEGQEDDINRALMRTGYKSVPMDAQIGSEAVM